MAPCRFLLLTWQAGHGGYALHHLDSGIPLINPTTLELAKSSAQVLVLANSGIPLA